MSESEGTLSGSAGAEPTKPAEPSAADKMYPSQAAKEPAAKTEEPTAEPEKKPAEEADAGSRDTKAEEKPEKEGDDKGEGEDKKEGAPEEYTDFTLPEDVVLDTELLGNFKDLAKKHNLSQENAQEFVDLYNGALARGREQLNEHWAEVRSEWVKEVKSDPEIGGAKFDQSMEYVGKVINQFGSPALRDELNSTGFGDNPEFFRFFVNVGKALSEDKIHTGSARTTGPMTPEQRAARMYPSMTQNKE